MEPSEDESWGAWLVDSENVADAERSMAVPQVLQAGLHPAQDAALTISRMPLQQ